MAATITRDYLGEFQDWGYAEKQRAYANVSPVIRESTVSIDQPLSQRWVFQIDRKRCPAEICLNLKTRVIDLSAAVATLAASPFAIFAEIDRCWNGSIRTFTCLKNICKIPVRIACSLVRVGLCLFQIMRAIGSAVGTAVGFVAWHAAEAIVRCFRRTPETVLSNVPMTRDIVYESIGTTLVAIGALFIPIPSIQLMALPIVFGSLYGAINNRFTVKECPEYYTMGHYFDGENLRGHAVKTNNMIVKPIVTGCYATTMVTKITGSIFAAIGMAAVFSVPVAAVLMAAVTAVSLIAAHVFAKNGKQEFQKNLDDYAALIGIEWNGVNQNQSWRDLEPLRKAKIEAKTEALAKDNAAVLAFHQQVYALEDAIESKMSGRMIPMKYVVGWHANSKRNLVGYIAAGIGTLGLAAASMFMRIHGGTAC